MKKCLVIWLIALFISIAFTPVINANVSNTFFEDVQNEISIKINAQKSQITNTINNVFLIGKISNVRRGGYTPSYWFHIDNVMTIRKQEPHIQWIKNREGHMLAMDFFGFVFKNIIFGKTSEILIYD